MHLAPSDHCQLARVTDYNRSSPISEGEMR